MRALRQVNIKNCHHHFFNSMINVKNFDTSLLSIDKISFKSTDSVIYGIKYITMKSLDSANSLYLVFNNEDAYIEENSEDKYLIFAFTDKDKKELENYAKFWDEIQDQIEIISGNKPIEYEKDFMKIKFESDDNLPLGIILNIPVCIIAVGSVFQEDNYYYPHINFYECLYEQKYEDEYKYYSTV